MKKIPDAVIVAAWRLCETRVGCRCCPLRGFRVCDADTIDPAARRILRGYRTRLLRSRKVAK